MFLPRDIGSLGGRIHIAGTIPAAALEVDGHLVRLPVDYLQLGRHDPRDRLTNSDQSNRVANVIVYHEPGTNNLVDLEKNQAVQSDILPHLLWHDHTPYRGNTHPQDLCTDG